VVAAKPKIMLIEGKRADRPSFFTGLTRKGFQVETVGSGSAALTDLAVSQPNLILLDAASMRTSGKRIVQSIRQKYPHIPMLLVLEEGSKDQDKLDRNSTLVEPFTLQKLLNRIRPLLPDTENETLKAGPLELNTEQRWVRFQNRQIRLTPRLITLLKILMDHPGEVIERDELFRQVWETAYIGDTRTLDVHISWLRQAIEEDPRRPQFIKTVRGIGYRLDLPSTAIKAESLAASLEDSSRMAKN